MKSPFKKIVSNLFGSKRNANKRPKIEWAEIPAGTFVMGSPLNEPDRKDDETQHQVTLHAFKMSKYAVTFDQYDMFCEITGRVKPGDLDFGRKKYPAINISWDNAMAFAKWMGCHLPTEVEWEYACRAGTKTAFNTGDNLTYLQANFNAKNEVSYTPKDDHFTLEHYLNEVKQTITVLKDEFRGKTLPVGSFAPNSWGLFDMHGNVMEWCRDLYGDYLLNNQVNPQGPATGEYRVLRGGSWIDGVKMCRSAGRNYLNPFMRNNNIGFRLVSYE